MQLYVNLSRLNSSVSQLKRLAGEYRKLYRQLLQTVKTAPGWESQDGVVFRNQLAGFEDDFERMAKLMEAYAAMAETAGKYYRDGQKTVVTMAKRLY